MVRDLHLNWGSIYGHKQWSGSPINQIGYLWIAVFFCCQHKLVPVAIKLCQLLYFFPVLGYCSLPARVLCMLRCLWKLNESQTEEKIRTRSRNLSNTVKEQWNIFVFAFGQKRYFIKKPRRPSYNRRGPSSNLRYIFTHRTSPFSNGYVSSVYFQL